MNRYMLARLNGAKSAVECGTSYGVSTIYLGLAISQNAGGKRDDAFGVLTVEKDKIKTERARGIWKEAGQDIEDWIMPHEGDLLKVLAMQEILPRTIDLLFLDGMWTYNCVSGVAQTHKLTVFSMDIPGPTGIAIGIASTPSRLTGFRRQDSRWCGSVRISNPSV